MIDRLKSLFKRLLVEELGEISVPPGSGPTANPNPWTANTVLVGNASSTPIITGVTIDGSNNVNFQAGNITTTGAAVIFLGITTNTGFGLTVSGQGALTPVSDGLWKLVNHLGGANYGTLQIQTIQYNTVTSTGPGGVAGIVAASAAIANTETQIVGFTIPANTMIVGTRFHIHASGNITTSTSPGNGTFRIRIGTTTLTGNIPVSVAAAANASVTTQPFTLDAWVTIRTIGASGSVIGDMQVFSGGALATGAFTNATNAGVSTATVAVDTTAAKIIELTFISGAATFSATFQTASIDWVQ